MQFGCLLIKPFPSFLNSTRFSTQLARLNVVRASTIRFARMCALSSAMIVCRLPSKEMAVSYFCVAWRMRTAFVLCSNPNECVSKFVLEFNWTANFASLFRKRICHTLMQRNHKSEMEFVAIKYANNWALPFICRDIRIEWKIMWLTNITLFLRSLQKTMNEHIIHMMNKKTPHKFPLMFETKRHDTSVSRILIFHSSIRALSIAALISTRTSQLFSDDNYNLSATRRLLVRAKYCQYQNNVCAMSATAQRPAVLLLL